MEKQEAEKRTNRITILLTKEEKAAIEKRAKAQRVQSSMLCRQYIFCGIGVIQKSMFD